MAYKFAWLDTVLSYSVRQGTAVKVHVDEVHSQLALGKENHTRKAG
jgi:hypothetical protein